MNWSLVATGAIGLVTLFVLIKIIKKSTERDALKEVNSQLNKSVDDLAKNIRKQEKRELAHEKRIIEIAKSHNLNRDHIQLLLNTWAIEDSKTGKATSDKP